MLEYTHDERRKVIVPGNLDETIEYATEQFISIAQEAIENKNSFYVALSGGSTPKKIFENLAKLKFRESIDWKSVYVFWSDERSVSPDSPESNYNMACKAFLDHLPIPRNQIFRMVAEVDTEANAAIYEDIIRRKLLGNPFDFRQNYC